VDERGRENSEVAEGKTQRADSVKVIKGARRDGERGEQGREECRKNGEQAINQLVSNVR